jgi:hypothetical protein
MWHAATASATACSLCLVCLISYVLYGLYDVFYLLLEVLHFYAAVAGISSDGLLISHITHCAFNFTQQRQTRAATPCRNQQAQAMHSQPHR